MPTITASTAPSTLIQAQDMGLTPDEFKSIEKILGRVPNFTEMCIYSVMWSEHCSYKNSIKWLKMFGLLSKAKQQQNLLQHTNKALGNRP